MEHISEIEIIEYVAGHLAEPRINVIREHIAQCLQCSQRIEQARKFSDTLGTWEVDTSGHDVAERVIALAKETEYTQPSSSVNRIIKFMPQVLRVAASIIIAIGVGHKLGEYSVANNKSQVASSDKKPEYLAALGLEWSSGLVRMVLEGDSTETESQ